MAATGVEVGTGDEQVDNGREGGGKSGWEQGDRWSECVSGGKSRNERCVHGVCVGRHT